MQLLQYGLVSAWGLRDADQEGFFLQISIVDGSSKHRLEVTWTNGQHKATLKADVEDMSFDIIATQPAEDNNELHTYRCVSCLHFFYASPTEQLQ